VGPRAGLGAVAKRKYSYLCREANRDRPVRSLVTIRTEVSQLFITHTRVYPKVSGLAAWSENCKWYRSLPLGAVV
jgi:hypothetical protein